MFSRYHLVNHFIGSIKEEGGTGQGDGEVDEGRAEVASSVAAGTLPLSAVLSGNAVAPSASACVGMSGSISVCVFMAVCGVSEIGTPTGTGTANGTGAAAASPTAPREGVCVGTDMSPAPAGTTTLDTDTDPGTDTDTDTAEVGGTGLLEVDTEGPFLSFSLSFSDLSAPPGTDWFAFICSLRAFRSLVLAHSVRTVSLYVHVQCSGNLIHSLLSVGRGDAM